MSRAFRGQVRDRNVHVIVERSHIACVAAATLVLGAGCGGGSAEGPSESAARSDRGIVFSSKRDGDFEIYVMEPDGSDVRQLTRNESQGENEADDGSPAWSPDGPADRFHQRSRHEQ